MPPINLSLHGAPAAVQDSDHDGLIINMPQIGCMACGATTEAACDCGVPYLPAGERAAAAIVANPERSDRAIASEIGVDHKTVAAARRLVGESSPPEGRIGRDGKRYPPKPPREPPNKDDPHVTFGRYCYMAIVGAENATELIPALRCETEEMFEFAKNAASAWREVAERLSPVVAKYEEPSSAVKSAADRAEAKSRARAVTS
jgi:hypothetical protein